MSNHRHPHGVDALVAAFSSLSHAFGRTPMTDPTAGGSFVRELERVVGADDRELIAPDDVATGVAVHRIPHTDTVHTVDLERYLDSPRRPRGNTVVHDPKDFASYVTRVSTPRTTVWADQATRKVTAVINDAEIVTGDNDGPDGGDAHGWRDHTVVLELQPDPEWSAWLALDGKLIGQAAMVEHLEAYGRNVTTPDAATMMDLATELRATRSAEFESAYRDKTGDMVVKYEQTTRYHKGEKGDLEVPDRIGITLAPYVGFPDVTLDGAFLVRVQGQDDPNPGRLTLGFRLVRPDLKLREAFDEVRNTIVNGLEGEVPVYLGAAPRAISSSAAGAS